MRFIKYLVKVIREPGYNSKRPVTVDTAIRIVHSSLQRCTTFVPTRSIDSVRTQLFGWCPASRYRHVVALSQISREVARRSISYGEAIFGRSPSAHLPVAMLVEAQAHHLVLGLKRLPLTPTISPQCWTATSGSPTSELTTSGAHNYIPRGG